MNLKDRFDFGARGMLGFAWRLKKAPVTLQVDWMPTIFFVGDSEIMSGNAGVTARYVLNRKRFKD